MRNKFVFNILLAFLVEKYHKVASLLVVSLDWEMATMAKFCLFDSNEIKANYKANL